MDELQYNILWNKQIKVKTTLIYFPCLNFSNNLGTAWDDDDDYEEDDDLEFGSQPKTNN